MLNVNLGESIGEHSWFERYIHKYYLPNDLKKLLSPIDLEAVEHCNYSKEEKNEALKAPRGMTIYYRDINAHKVLSWNSVKIALQAIDAYSKDCKSKPSEEEYKRIVNLNKRLITLEKDILNEFIRIDADMKDRGNQNLPFAWDYEIDIELVFYVHNGDSFFDNEEADEYDCDSDASQICLLKEWIHLPEKNNPDKDLCGIGDGFDHRYSLAIKDHPLLADERLCWLFHELYDCRFIPLKHMARIGEIMTTIEVWHQDLRRL